MNTNIPQDNKKSLDELSKEELIEKCKGLLRICQVAKQAKNTLQEENNQLKIQLNQKNVVVDANTRGNERNINDKLDNIDDLKAKNITLESNIKAYLQELHISNEKLNQLDSENLSYKRQVTRLTDENEQLITHLESLEKQIEELKRIGSEQQNQLLELEKNNKIIGESSKTQNEDKVNELQNMLSISLGEIKKLQTENDSITNKVKELEAYINDKAKTLNAVNEELKIKTDIVEKLTLELTTCNQNNDLQTVNDKLREKLKFYHSKIVKFAGNAKALKEDKNEIIKGFKLYVNQVKEWKEQLESASNKLIKHISQLENENESTLKVKNELCSDNERLKDEINKYLKSEDDLKNTIALLTSEKENISKKYNNEIQLLKEQTLQRDQVDNSKEEKSEIVHLMKEIEELSKLNDEYKMKIDDLSEEKNSLDKIINDHRETSAKTIMDLEKSIEEINKNAKSDANKLLECETLISNLKLQLNDQTNAFENESKANKETINKLLKELEHSKATEKQLAEKSGEEILKLVQEIKDLTNLNNKMQAQLDEIEHAKSRLTTSECQTDEDLVPTNELEETIVTLKRENAELLTEMNEMNQALKERGETISKLESHCDEIMKKLQIYETQANKNVDNISQKEEIIKSLKQEIDALKIINKSNVVVGTNNDSTKDDEITQLKNEIEVLKEKINNNMENSYAESETMSTSTISRTDEVNRLKDLDGSWEERYGKLRNLAIKLKGKIRELTTEVSKEQAEKCDLQQKLANTAKTIQTLQQQCDHLEDQLDTEKKQSKQYVTKLNSVAGDISKDKQLLVSNDDLINKLKLEIDEYKKEKQTTDNWKKQVSAKVQTLRKELDAHNVLKKEYDLKISKLQADIATKEQALKSEIESHKQTKNLLEQSNTECKKKSVLNLEMQDYERSVKELSQKLDKKQEEITQLQTQLDTQKSTVNALREQNKLLEDRIQNEESDLNAASSEINTFKKKISELESSIAQKEDKIASITQLLETARSENEELSTELSKVIAEHQKVNGTLKTEKEQLRSQNIGLHQSLREVQDALKLKEEEIKLMQIEYEGYKVRAQSVLRQNQNRDVGLEEKLSEEAASLRAQNNSVIAELDILKEKNRLLENANEKLSAEKEEISKKCRDVEEEIEEIKNQFTQLSNNHQKTLAEHAETVRSLKVHADTLSQCYRQQISEQEVRHNREIIELQSRLDKAPSPVEQLPPVHPTMHREEGEGSESVESTTNAPVYPVPLERLLGSDSDQEVTYIKKLLREQEYKVNHLTALLSDTEQDLAKHVQMNKLLKEEIRRQQRSVEREKHAENLEYLKNVVFKFVTLNSGDERTRLVPVLNTILKLSPEETQKLNAVAKGDPGLRGWTNYLPTWSSPNKPQ